MKFFLVVMAVVSCQWVYGIEVQGHRGGRSLFPENTLPAFEAAMQAKVHTLELDIQATQDGHLVIYHDFFLKKEHRKGLGVSSSLIYELKLSDLKKVDCGIRQDPDFPNQRCVPGASIPTLNELFTMLNESSHPHAKKVRLNIEIKRDPRFPAWTLAPKEFAEKILSLVREHGFSERVYYSSFDPEILKAIARQDPKAELALIFQKETLEIAENFCPENPLGFLLHIATALKVKILSPEDSLIGDKISVQALQQRGFRVIPWTVNSPYDWDKLLKLGVDGIITDYPQDLLQFINNLRK
jgi:glycerophosphoryl diester phosphodiesterase